MHRLQNTRRRLRANRLRLAAVASLLAALGIAVWLYAPGPTVAEKAVALAVPNPAVATSTDTTFGPVNTSKPVQKKAVAKPAADGSRLVIERIGVEVGVYGGDSAKALKRGVYHHAGTADPGEPGNVVFAGHRNRRQFSLLHQVKIGDTITVSWRGENHAYKVSKKFTVKPDDTWIMRQTGADRLTLYTCLPRSVGNKRTVVVALPVKP